MGSRSEFGYRLFDCSKLISHVRSSKNALMFYVVPVSSRNLTVLTETRICLVMKPVCLSNHWRHLPADVYNTNLEDGGPRPLGRCLTLSHGP